MCGSKGSTVSSTSGPPQEFLQAYKDVYGMARGLSGQPYQSYTGPMVAGFTPDQLSAFGTIQNAQGLAQPYFNQAASYMGASADPISPMGFNVNGGDYSQFLPGVGLDYFTYAGKRSEQAADLANRAATPIELMQYDIDPYLSPYTENVTNSLATLYNRQNAEQFNAARGNAAAQGAFGGDREAILAAEMARQQKMAQDPTLAQIRQAGFASAQEEFNKQQAVDLQRQMAERQYLLGAAGSTLGSGQLGLGIGQGIWGEFNTQQAQDVAAQQASAYLQAQAGQGLASLGNLAQNSALAGAQIQLGAGQQQQQLAQQRLNVPYYQFMQQQAYPYQQLGWLSNIATGLGGASGGNASTTYPGPSTLGQLGGLATAGVGLLGQTGAFGSDGWLTGGWGSSGGGFGDFGGGGELGFPPTPGFSADGGAVPHRAPGGAVGLAVPPEFGGSLVPEGLDSYIPGADGMGAKPANPQGGGLNKMFMQPVTTQTQSGGGGGGILGSILGLATKAIPLLLDDGGAVVPRGTGLAHGYDGGGPVRYQARAAAPIVADLTHVPPPSSFGPVAAESVRPTMNFAPTFDPQGYPGALVGVPNDWTVPPPLSLPMVNGIMQRPQIGGPSPEVLGVPVPVADPGLATPPSLIDFLSISDLNQGGASGGHVGLGGIGHFDDGGPVVPVQPPTPDQQLLEKLKRIQELQKIRLEDRWPRFSNMPDAQKRDAGGMIYPSLSQGYIPQAPALSRAPMMGVPKPPSLAQPPQQQGSMSPIADFLKQLSSSGLFGGQGGSLGGAVQPSATPLQYDDGGEVAAPESPTQQRALLQQYANLPLDKLRELAMRYPATTPQGAAIQRALQMKQINPAGAMGSGPAGPSGPAGTVTPGTTAARGGGIGDDDWLEPPPKDWKPGDPIKQPDGQSYGLAAGGFPDEEMPFGPELRDARILIPNDVSGVTEQPMGGLDMPPPPPLAEVPSYDRVLSTPAAGYPPPQSAVPPWAKDTPATWDKYTPSGPPPSAQRAALSGFRQNIGAPSAGMASDKIVPFEPAYSGLVGAPDRVDNWETQHHNYGGLRRPGVVAGPNAGGFQSFDSPEAGVAAIAKQLNRYASGATTGRPLNTIRQIVSTWAPSRENDTALLIDRASKVTGFSPDQPLDLSDAATMSKMIEATIRNEQGGKLPVSPALIAQVAADPSAFTAPAGTAGPGEMASGVFGTAPPAGQGRGVQRGVSVVPLGSEAASAGSSQGLANPPSFSLRTTDDNRTMRDMTSSPWAMLIATGAGMLASRSPYPGVALGEGLQIGLKLAGSMADRENKEELADIRRQSSAVQAQDLVERAQMTREKMQQDASNQALMRQRDFEALDHKRQTLEFQQAQAQSKQELDQFKARSEDEKRKSDIEHQRRMEEINQQLADTRKKLSEITKGRWEPGESVDPETGRRIPGSVFYPNDGGEPQFKPNIFMNPRSGAGTSGRKAMFDKLIADGLATDYVDAERKVAEARRNPDTFRNSAIYSRLLASEKKALGDAPSTMMMDEAARERLARKRVDERLGIAAGVVGAPAPASPGARPQSPVPAAPAGPPAGTVVGGYRFKGGNPNDRGNWEPVQ